MTPPKSLGEISEVTNRICDKYPECMWMPEGRPYWREVADAFFTGFCCLLVLAEAVLLVVMFG